MPLGSDQRQEAVGLLAELLLDAARKREGVVSDVGFDSALDRASGGVAPLRDEGAKPQRAA